MSAVLGTFEDDSGLDWNSTLGNHTGDPLDHGAEHEGGHAHHVTLAVLTLTILLGVAVAVWQAVQKLNVDWLSGAGTSLLVGMGMGLILKVFSLPSEFEGVFTFSTEFFFIALLPPIIFDAAFRLKTRPFFHNIGAILMLAFGGTFASVLVTAVFMYVVGVAGLSYPISFFHACMFGVIISATDPVTILSAFRKHNADKDMRAIIFGESILNDAVCIVLFRVISKFTFKAATFGGVVHAMYSFCKIFLCSLGIGALFGIGAAWIFKTRYFRNEHTSLEASLVIIFAYCSFYMADGCGMSGIVSIMVCGIMMANYVRPNLDASTNDRIGSFFSVISSLAENFVFIYIGFAIFTESAAWSHGLTWGFVGFCLVAIGLARAATVFPSLMTVNVFRPPEMAIPRNHMVMAWFSGQRGSMAFALAMLARSRLGESGSIIITATFFIVLITVLVNGGATVSLMKYLNLLEVAPGAQMMSGADKLNVLVGPSADSDLHVSSPPIGTSSTHGPSLHGTSTHGGKAMGVREKIHEFQRSGGLAEQFRIVDRTLGKVLINTEVSPSHSPNGHGHGSRSTPDIHPSPLSRGHQSTPDLHVSFGADARSPH